MLRRRVLALEGVGGLEGLLLLGGSRRDGVFLVLSNAGGIKSNLSGFVQAKKAVDATVCTLELRFLLATAERLYS